METDYDKDLERIEEMEKYLTSQNYFCETEEQKLYQNSTENFYLGDKDSVFSNLDNLDKSNNPDYLDFFKKLVFLTRKYSKNIEKRNREFNESSLSRESKAKDNKKQ